MVGNSHSEPFFSELSDSVEAPVRLAPVDLLVAEPAAGPHLTHVAALHQPANCVLLVAALEGNLKAWTLSYLIL